jgi:hypothetical protein
MNGQHFGAGLPEAGDVPLRLHDHQVHIKRLARVLADGVQHREPEGDVRHEDPVHDVDVEPVGFAAVDQFHIALEVAEIGGEYGRGYKGHGAGAIVW